MGRRTENEIDLAIVGSRRSVRRASLALLVFYLWLAVTAVGPAVSLKGWSFLETLLALSAYSALSVLALGLLARGTLAVIRNPELRAVVSGRIAPFWALSFFGFLAGAAVTGALSVDPVRAVLMGTATCAATLLSGAALAQYTHLRELRVNRRLVSYSPDRTSRAPRISLTEP